MSCYTPPGAITAPPEQFRRWLADNSDRLARAAERGTTPYFITNNSKYTAPEWKPTKDEITHESRNQTQDERSDTKNASFPIVPPHTEEYISYNEGRIKVSPLHGKDELQSNLRLAETMHDVLGETVYLLPNINPKGAEAHLRPQYIPEGVKKDKNADFLCANRIWDGKKASFENSDRSRKSVKSILENHIKKAKLQADNMIIEIPNWVKEEWVDQIVKNHLSLTSVDRWIIIRRENGEWLLYKK